MKNRSSIRLVCIVLMMFIVKNATAGQDVIITPSVYSTAPGWQSGQSINICSGSFHLRTIVNNTSSTTISNLIITQTFPYPLYAPFTQVQGLFTLACGTAVQTGGQITYTIPSLLPGTCILDVVLEVPCNYTDANGSATFSINTSSTHSSVVQPINSVTGTVVKPVLLIGNFSDGTIPIPQAPPQQLAITPSAFRQFDLTVNNNSMVESFTLGYVPEAEIAFNHFEIYATDGSGIPIAATLSINTYPFTVTPAMIQQMTGGNAFLIQGDIIRVKEFFSVYQCSDDIGSSDETQYLLDVHCPNRSPEQDCFHTEIERSITVAAVNTAFNPSFSISNTMDICGATPSDITFTFANGAVAAGQAPGSGDKTMDTILFAFDTNWVNINWNQVFLVSGDQQLQVPISSLPPDFLTYDPLVKTFTVNFHSAAFSGSSPLPGIFTDGFIPDGNFNEFIQGTSFSIVFRNTTFDCNGVNNQYHFFQDCVNSI